jgi:predicted transcriptional regulator
MKPTYYTSDELAREIGVSAMTIRNRVAAQKITPDAYTNSGKMLFTTAKTRKLEAAEKTKRNALAVR